MLKEGNPGWDERQLVDTSLEKLLKNTSLVLIESHSKYKRTLKDTTEPDKSIIMSYKFTDHFSGIFEKITKKTFSLALKFQEKNKKVPLYYHIYKALLIRYHNPVYAIYDKKSNSITFRRLLEISPTYWELYDTKTNIRRFQCSLSPNSMDASSFYDLATGKLPTTLMPNNQAADIVTLFKSYINESRENERIL